MLRSLRNRLIISHVLPLIIILPLLGLALAYLLETQYLLPRITTDFANSAELIARFAANEPEIWLSSDYAQGLLENAVTETSATVMLLTPDAHLIASSIPLGPSAIGASLVFPELQKVQAGNTVRITNFLPRQNEEAIDIFSPAINTEGKFVGIVRVTYRASIFYAEFRQFRFIIGGILLFALIVGSGIGYLLASNISIPIQRATEQIYRVASGDVRLPQTEQGPEEIRLFIRATNYLVEQLNNLEQSRRQLLANLVHELGRPIGSLRSAIQALSKGAGRDPQLLDELTLGMDQETLRLQRLVEDLAHLHEQALGIMELDLQSLPLSDWLPTILPPWRQAAQERHQHWQSQIPEDLPVIQADPIRLAQILDNLISNAIKYTPVGGTIDLSAGADPESVWICVSDTGPGISQDELKLIFSPYYRGKSARRIRQGMGLGLSIAQDLVSAHGARLEVDSTPGLGSHFTVRFPR